MKKNLIFVLSASLILLLSLSIVSAVSITGYASSCFTNEGNANCSSCGNKPDCEGASGCSWKQPDETKKGKCTGSAEFIGEGKTKTVSLGRGWKPTKADDGTVCYLPPEKNTKTRTSLNPLLK